MITDLRNYDNQTEKDGECNLLCTIQKYTEKYTFASLNWMDKLSAAIWGIEDCDAQW